MIGISFIFEQPEYIREEIPLLQPVARPCKDYHPDTMVGPFSELRFPDSLSSKIESQFAPLLNPQGSIKSSMIHAVQLYTMVYQGIPFMNPKLVHFSLNLSRGLRNLDFFTEVYRLKDNASQLSVVSSMLHFYQFVEGDAKVIDGEIVYNKRRILLDISQIQTGHQAKRVFDHKYEHCAKHSLFDRLKVRQGVGYSDALDCYERLTQWDM